MNYSELSSQVPDTIKVASATAAPVLHFLGVPVEQWGYVLSIVVSLIFIVEKFPTMMNRAKSLKEWINAKRKK